MNRILPETLALIKAWEGFFPTPYVDTGGGLTIGYGHSSVGPPAVTPDSRWDEETASKQLEDDLVLVGTRIARDLRVRVNDYQWGALLSLAYNKGPTRLVKSRVWSTLHDGQKYASVRAGLEILSFATSAQDKVTGEVREFLGLRARRAAEAGYFLKRHHGF